MSTPDAPEPTDSEGTTVVDPTDATDATDVAVPTEHHEPPRGTMLIVGLFLLMMAFMFGWAYLILIVRG